MFPISKLELSFDEISEYWAAELNLSRERVQALLESAWWLGEILGDPSLPTRLELLKSLFKRMRDCESPRLLFITPDSEPPAKTVEQPDKSLHINLRPCVLVPSADTDTWSEGTCFEAFQAMAQIPSSEYYPEYLPGFVARKLTSKEFFKWIAKRDFELPKFWKQTNDKAISPHLKPAPELIIDDVVREVYDMALEKPPNIKEVAKPVQAILQERGYEASARQIQVVANRPEFKRRRRAPGKTLKSEKHGPRK